MTKIIEEKIQKDDKTYWDNYYKKNPFPFLPSSFAEFVMQYLSEKKNLIELGCGNGRDSVYFASERLNVMAIDQVEHEIDFLNSQFGSDSLKFIADDFTNLSTELRFDYIYSRFTMHSITEKQENRVLDWISKALNPGGYFMLEARSEKDEMLLKGMRISSHENITDHYRRYMKFDLFKEKLEKINLKVVFSVEEKGLAVRGSDDPVIIRIIAEKTHHSD